MNKQDSLFKCRLVELSKIAYQRSIITYTDFLNLNELDILKNIPKHELYSNYECFGGYEYAERQIVAFLPDAISYEKTYPYSILKVTPKSAKFAQALTHRDYLGSILGLGIERCKIGDIIVNKDSVYVFAHHDMDQYILEHLFKIKNTMVDVCYQINEEITFEIDYEVINGTISSLRLDNIIALVHKESRSKIIRYIEGGKVFVNGKLITTNAYKIQDNDLISIRGFGKFQFVEVLSKTKKDRLYVSVKKFV